MAQVPPASSNDCSINPTRAGTILLINSPIIVEYIHVKYR